MAETHRRPIAEQFALFADAIGDEVPLYTRLCEAIAEDEELLALAGRVQPGQPAANMLFGAVQYLLLGGVDHPLRAWYPAVSEGMTPSEDPVPEFRDFCRRHRDEIGLLVSTRRSQTNEVARCVGLLPALTSVADRVGGPLALIEIGASAGLLLMFHRYHYTYGAATWGPADSPVRLSTQLRGAQPRLAKRIDITSRLGIDLHPVDITAPRDARWLDAMVWPGHEERRRRLRAAIALVAPNPPRLMAGDALELLPHALASVPARATPVVMHSFALIQWNAEDRDRLGELLRSAGRPIHRIWLEWFGYQKNGPLLRRFEYRDGAETVETLGRFHYHGRWLDWGWTGE